MKNLFRKLFLSVCAFVFVLCFSACSFEIKGENGKSAYEIWLDAGNTGTEQDFLDSLKGEKGDKGDQGEKGETGAAGTNGTNSADATITINEDGFWVINGVITDVKAAGKDGANGTNGVDGKTPTIEINADGYWVINGTATTVKAKGEDGKPGADGASVTNAKLNDKGELILTIGGKEVNVGKVTGEDGKDGAAGAQGPAGEAGADGKGISKVEVVEDKLIITYTDKTSESFTLPKLENPCEHTNYKSYVMKESTCQVKGEVLNVCADNCGYSWITYLELDPENHDLNNSKIYSPTCTEGGYTTCICENENIKYNLTDALGHTYERSYTLDDIDTTIYVKPTCEVNGTKTCGDCGYVLDHTKDASLLATGHTYNAPVNMYDDGNGGLTTDNSNGVATLKQLWYYCNVEGCGYINKVDVDNEEDSTTQEIFNERYSNPNISLNSVINLGVGESYNIDCKVTSGTVTYSILLGATSMPDAVKVSESGVVTALKVGTAFIKVDTTSYGSYITKVNVLESSGITYPCSLVSEVDGNTLTISHYKFTMKVGDIVDLTFTSSTTQNPTVKLEHISGAEDYIFIFGHTLKAMKAGTRITILADFIEDDVPYLIYIDIVE